MESVQWKKLQEAAPPRPVGRPSEDELVALQKHKRDVKSFLSKLDPEQRSHFETPKQAAKAKKKENKTSNGTTEISQPTANGDGPAASTNETINDHEKLVFDNPNNGSLKRSGKRSKFGPIYKRSWSLARGKLGDKMLELYGLDKNAASICLPSGMATIGATTSSLLQAGRQQQQEQADAAPFIVIHGDELYSDVPKAIQYICEQQENCQAISVDIRDSDGIKALFEQHGSRILVFHYEACTNPSGQMMDFSLIPELKALAPQCTFVCDNTWLTGVLFNPFQHGADLTVESCTKYLSGGTCIGGTVCGANEPMQPVVKWSRVFGQFVPDSVIALFSDQLLGLHERVERASETAMKVAQAMEQDERLSRYIDRVMYPGLESHPTHNRAKQYCLNGLFSGCIWFHVPKGRNAVQRRLPDAKTELKTSFGGPESRFDPWPTAGAATKYDSGDLKTTEEANQRKSKQETNGTWLRLSLGFDEDSAIVLEKLYEDVVILTM